MAAPRPDLSQARNREVAPPLDRPAIRRLDDLPEWRSICGFRRDLLAAGESPYASIHYMRIEGSVRHHHRRTTEFYYVVEGEGWMELAGEWHPIRKGDLIVVPPHTWHTSKHDEGKELHILIVACPPETTGHADCYFEAEALTPPR